MFFYCVLGFHFSDEHFLLFLLFSDFFFGCALFLQQLSQSLLLNSTCSKHINLKSFGLVSQDIQAEYFFGVWSVLLMPLHAEVVDVTQSRNAIKVCQVHREFRYLVT